ncbi:BTB/POZ domain-containing protein [Acrasis kona]|uniref:BTB/POZ domain-containing protein n=1 Tax=Acrasis kona TaxID=1008807 RepID=A0AAW2YT75_9EUKA
MNEVLTLNVGGYFYTTARGTLMKPIHRQSVSSFQDILNNDVIKDSKGRIFIDRDGKNFGFILNYVRNDGDMSKTQLPWGDPRLIQEIQLDAEFFGLLELAQSCSDYFVRRRKVFNTNNCHRSLSIGENGIQLRCLQSQPRQKSWYSVRMNEPLITSEETQQRFDQSSLTSVDINYIEILLDNTTNQSNVVLGVSKSQASYFLSPWRVGDTDYSYGYHVSSAKKIHRKQEVTFGERCGRGDRIGMHYDWRKNTLHYFKNGRPLGCAFSDIDLGRSTDRWCFVVSLMDDNDIVRIVQSEDRPSVIENKNVNIPMITTTYTQINTLYNTISDRTRKV